MGTELREGRKGGAGYAAEEGGNLGFGWLVLHRAPLKAGGGSGKGRGGSSKCSLQVAPRHYARSVDTSVHVAASIVHAFRVASATSRSEVPLSLTMRAIATYMH